MFVSASAVASSLGHSPPVDEYTALSSLYTVRNSFMQYYTQV